MSSMQAPFQVADTADQAFDSVASTPANILWGLFYNVQRFGNKGKGPGLHAAGNGAPNFEDYFCRIDGQWVICLFRSNAPRLGRPPIGFIVFYESKVSGANRRWAACHVVETSAWTQREGGGYVATCKVDPDASWCGGGIGASSWGDVTVNDMLAVHKARAVTDNKGKDKGITEHRSGTVYMNGPNQRGYVKPVAH